MVRSFWLWLSGINEYYDVNMFFKEFCGIAIIYIMFAGLLAVSYFLN